MHTSLNSAWTLCSPRKLNSLKPGTLLIHPLGASTIYWQAAWPWGVFSLASISAMHGYRSASMSSACLPSRPSAMISSLGLSSS